VKSVVIYDDDDSAGRDAVDRTPWVRRLVRVVTSRCVSDDAFRESNRRCIP